ncbi:MAG: protein kinase domain-containing protein [Anaerolineae bacterium]
MSSIHFLLGKTLGKYQVVEHLGHGGMAEVYLGQQSNLDRQVAIKVLHPFLAEEQGFVTRFQREARIVATMRHPNIVQVYDFDHNEELDIYYMVMEYIHGATLKERLLEESSLDQEEAVFIVAAIADALDYAHRREMIHRDIKPANIMFTDEGQPVLADFGIARMLSLTGLTASGAMVGTPAYMAPEIGAGQSATKASDIYSLGVVLYQTVTGHPPFEAEVPMGLVMKHINDPVPSPRQFVPGLSRDLEAAIFKSLAKQPEARFATAGEMAAALRGAMGMEVPPLTPQGNGQQAAVARTVAAENEPHEEGEPLLRQTWPGAPNSNDIAREGLGERRKSSPVLHLLRGSLLVILLFLVGLGGWWVVAGSLPPFLSQVLSGEAATPWTDPNPTVTLTATEPPENTIVVSNPAPEETLTPTPTYSLPTEEISTLPCAHRAEVLRVYTSPATESVPPEASIIAYVTLRNGGNCAWPPDVRLAFIMGQQMSGLSALNIEAQPVGGQVQVLLPLRAPGEAGVYESVWEVQLPDGRPISSQITLQVEVSPESATPTPTPPFEEEITPTPTPPLSVESPEIIMWEVDEQQDVWFGEIQLLASGGTGRYTFYRDSIGSGTEIPDGLLQFSWSECRDFPLQIIVVSGEAVEYWEGSIPYPAPDQCAP